jgi:cold shock CspA family protein
MTGILIRFLDERHFGFIKCEAGEIFAHELNFEYSPITKGDRVEFELGTFKGRQTALKIQLAGVGVRP